MVTIPTDNLLEQYFTGHCMFLAVALNEVFGWEIRANVDHDAKGLWIDHAWTVNKLGLAVDIDGVHDSDDPTDFTSDLKRNLNREDIRRLTRLSKEEFNNHVKDALNVVNNYECHFTTAWHAPS